MIRETLEQTRDLLTDIFTGKQPIQDKRLMEVKLQCVHALAALDAPFDISKVEGWKAMFVDEVWRFATPEHRWELQLVMNWWWRIVQDDRIVFSGEIKTHSFFLALCEALNISTAPSNSGSK